MAPHTERPTNLLLHACCGPCALEPVRLLRERGIEPHLYYANANIAPAQEYERRRSTIAAWAAEEHLAFSEAAYNPVAWEQAIAGWDAGQGDVSHARQERCRACYRMRFEQTVAHAKAAGFDAVGTTLSVSPYQYTQIIREELKRACAAADIRCFFEDYSPYYAQATQRSRQAEMYRQTYCGCRFSAVEAQTQREERMAARKAAAAHRASRRAIHEEQAAARRAERAAYAERQARKRAVLKQLRSAGIEGRIDENV